jgi:hypothetical protein
VIHIDKNLYLVREIVRKDKPSVYVHSAPISETVFDTYWKPIGKTFATIYSEGLGAVAGPRIANKALKDISKELGMWDGPTGVERGLVAEIRRLTNVIAPGERGWEMIPFDDPRVKICLDPHEISESEGAITFFTVAWCMHLRQQSEEMLPGAMQLWAAQITSSNCTVFLNSLPTLTADANSGAKAA